MFKHFKKQIGRIGVRATDGWPYCVVVEIDSAPGYDRREHTMTIEEAVDLRYALDRLIAAHEEHVRDMRRDS